jgi:hypothetical protein
VARKFGAVDSGWWCTEDDNSSDRLELYKLQEQLQAKNEDTRNLASGKAQLFLTPQDVNLKLSM